MTVVVKDMIALMEHVAPRHLAQEWDNSGLQCGDRNWPVKHVIVALDPSPSVVAAACKKNADLLITHHPLIFRPLKNLVLDTPLGKLLDLSLRHHLAIFSAHTNLDSVDGGLNDYFAEKIGLENLSLLAAESDDSIVKLAVYVPAGSYQKIFQTILETDAGIIGDYSDCTFRHEGIGTFRPGKDSRPFIGKPNSLEEVSEFRIETTVSKHRVFQILDQIRQSHPYETMAYDIYSLYPGQGRHGIGRIGDLKKPVTLASIAKEIKVKLGLPTVKVSGPPDLTVQRIAVCTGSGSGLMKQFLSTDADVYISGDLKFHDAKDTENNGRGLIDVGHFASEALMVDLVAARLDALIMEKELNVRVEAFKEEADPFSYI